MSVNKTLTKQPFQITGLYVGILGFVLSPSLIEVVTREQTTIYLFLNKSQRVFKCL